MTTSLLVTVCRL